MKKSPLAKRLDRRQFLKAAGAAVVLPAILPGSVAARDGKTPPSGKINLGSLAGACRDRGTRKAFLAEDDCQVVAACDLDKTHLQSAVDTINDHYQNKDCAAYHDYRELMARPDLDAVMIAIPDHWHALAATEAARGASWIFTGKTAGPHHR